MRSLLNPSICLFAVLFALPSLPIAKTYQAIKGESSISYHLHHPMHEIESASKDFDCTVDLNSDTTHSTIHVKASVISFSSGNSSRDSHMMEVMDAFKYPFVEFGSDSVRHEEKGYRVFGQLTFHGVKHPQDFVVTPTYLKGRVQITGDFTVKLSDYNIDRPSLMFVPTSNDLLIHLDVVAAGP